MKITIDKNIPYISEAFGRGVITNYLDGAHFTPETIADSDALIIRTRTKCNRKLLGNSNVKIIATATIGMDHIDLDYCAQEGIKVVNAAGCNARGVKQYVAAALLKLVDKGYELKGKTLGIIGVGNVGSEIVKLGNTLGLNVLCCDPIKMQTDPTLNYITQNELLKQADIVTLHVPLTADGRHATRGMADTAFFESMKPASVFINCSRGEVVNEQALITYIDTKKLSHVVLDVWNNEPNINSELLRVVDIATPHIAGYSLQGKANGTAMSVQAISRHFNLGLENWYPNEIEPNTVQDHEITAEYIIQHTPQCYDIMQDDNALRTAPEKFEELRNNYNYRIEKY